MTATVHPALVQAVYYQRFACCEETIQGHYGGHTLSTLAVSRARRVKTRSLLLSLPPAWTSSWDGTGVGEVLDRWVM